MIILFEGPDGTGKTTIARNRVNKLIDDKKTCLFFHCTSTSGGKSADEDYSKFLEELKHFKERGFDVVIDRAWVSNIVYTEVYEPGKAHISEKLAEELFKIVDHTIICLPEDKEKYMQHFTKLSEARHEDYVENMDKIYDKFNEFAKRFTRYDMFKNITDKPESLQLEDIIND